MSSKESQQDKKDYPYIYAPKTLFLSMLIVGVFIAAIIVRNSDIVLLNIFFISYLILGSLQAPDSENIQLLEKRTIFTEKNDDCYKVGVSLRITNNGKKNICIIASDPERDEIQILEGSLTTATALAPGEEIDMHYVFESMRGHYMWHNHSLMVSDPFGTHLGTVHVSTEEEFFLQPNYKKIRPFEIHPWRTLSSPGSIPTRMAGSGTEFRGVREYQPGDPLKTLDWRLTAKHPHKFFTREFEEEKTADIIFIVDGRENAELQYENKSLFEIELRSIASLSDMFLHQGHRVGLYTVGENILKTPPAYGKKQLYKILNCLSRAKVDSENSRSSLEALTLERFSPKAILFVFSPFNYSDVLFYRTLRSNGLQVVLICADPFDFAFQKSDVNKTDILALRAAKIEKRLNLRLLSQLSVVVIDWEVTQPLPALIKKALCKPIPITKL